MAEVVFESAARLILKLMAVQAARQRVFLFSFLVGINSEGEALGVARQRCVLNVQTEVFIKGEALIGVWKNKPKETSSVLTLDLSRYLPG